MITQENIKDIDIRVEKLREYLNIEQKLIEISNEEEKASNPEFWNNPREAEGLMRSLRLKKKWVEDFNTVKTNNEELQIIYDFYNIFFLCHCICIKKFFNFSSRKYQR